MAEPVVTDADLLAQSFDDLADSVDASDGRPEAAADHDDGFAETPPADLSIEGLIADLERVTLERDAFLDDSRRIAAEFVNFRRQTERRNVEVVEQAATGLVERLLPVLDASEAAVSHGSTDVEPIHNALLSILQKAGLAVMAPLDEPFDPALHEAVMHEDGDGGPQVVLVLRSGYLWNGKVLRPAMVKVRG